MKPSEVLALIGGSLLAVVGYTFLGSWLMGGSPTVAGAGAAAFVGLLGVLAGGTFVEALILIAIMSGVVGALFGLTSLPPVVGHTVLALASGVAGGQLIAAGHDALAPTRKVIDAADRTCGL